MEGGKGSHSSSNDTANDAASLDPAVRDVLVKRAEAEALQRQQDQKTTITKQAGDKEAEDEEEEIMKIVADQASLAVAEQLNAKEDFRQEKTNTASNHLLQRATEINEAAKIEELENAASSCNDRNWQSAGLAVQPEPIQQQSSTPGAYMGLPGEALQRAPTLQFSLVGSHASGQGEPLVQMGDPDDSSALAEPHDAGQQSSSTIATNIPSTNDPHLVVANLVIEDPEEEQTRPSADPVDLRLVQQRARKRKQQSLMFILFFVMLIIVTAVIVGAVAGTQQKEPEILFSSSTDAPTVFGSITPSVVPSSAPSGVLDLLLDTLPDYTLASINNGSETPHWRAWQWLANHQNITNLSEWRKTQLFALATFYYAFDGDNWYHLIKGHGWMDDTVDECDWFSSGFGYFDFFGTYTEFQAYGVAFTPPCNSQGQFTSLDLELLQLSGLPPSLPPEIALLTSLALVTLANLESSNDIDGPISSLIPTEFYEMTGLQSLTLWGDRFNDKIPSEISLLTSLSLLRFGLNRLSGHIPTKIGLLTSLSGLELYWNELTGHFPSELGLLTSLGWLSLAANQLTNQIPSELWLLTSLHSLLLEENQFTGQFPSELGLLTSLEDIWIHQNLLTGPVPSELGKLTALYQLLLGQNQLTGQVPSELGLLMTATELRFNENCLTGTIPSELGLLTSLDQLYLHGNQFTGRTPSEFGAFGALTTLWLNDNQFTGPVPMELWLLTSLSELYLYDNQFASTLPTEIGMMTSLTFLDLHNNNLTGTLPNQLNESMGLRLYGNQFSGTVPAHLCSLLWCDCSVNETPPVSTCADLKEAPPQDWPGRFPTRDAAVMLNIKTDDFPEETSWVWQKETNVTGIWDALESSGPLEHQLNLYSSPFPVNAGTAYRLVVSDSWGDGMTSGGITLTGSNETVLYSFIDGEAFSEISIDVLVGTDGSFVITNSTSL